MYFSLLGKHRAMNKYYCSGCGKTIKRESMNKYYYSYCDDSDKRIRMTNIKFLKNRGDDE